MICWKTWNRHWEKCKTTKSLSLRLPFPGKGSGTVNHYLPPQLLYFHCLTIRLSPIHQHLTEPGFMLCLLLFGKPGMDFTLSPPHTPACSLLPKPQRIFLHLLFLLIIIRSHIFFHRAKTQSLNHASHL